MDDWKTKYLFPAMGMIPIDRSGGSASERALNAAARVLEAGEFFGIYPEGTRSRDGVLHKGHTGPARLAFRTGAPILPTGVYFTPRYQGHHAIVRPPVPTHRLGPGLRDDVARVTQSLAHELEFLIRRAPEQWHLFQPNWPSDPGYGT